MTTISPVPIPASKRSERTDHVGIWASSLCAVHCLLTPVILIVAADFAGIWAHPAAHWVLAVITIPLPQALSLKAINATGNNGWQTAPVAAVSGSNECR